MKNWIERYQFDDTQQNISEHLFKYPRTVCGSSISDMVFNGTLGKHVRYMGADREFVNGLFLIFKEGKSLFRFVVGKKILCCWTQKTRLSLSLSNSSHV